VRCTLAYGKSRQSRNRGAFMMESDDAFAPSLQETTMATRIGKISRNEHVVFVDAALADCGSRWTATRLARLDAAWASIVGRSATS